jgi:hypothetical protein
MRISMVACDEKEETPVTNDAPVAKRAYQRPEVIELGDVRELTLSGTVGTKPDFTGMRRF